MGNTDLTKACGELKWSGISSSCLSTRDIRYDSFIKLLITWTNVPKTYAIHYHFVLKMPINIRRTDNIISKRRTNNDLLDVAQTQIKYIDWITRSLLKFRGELRCSGMVSNLCSTNIGTRFFTVKRLEHHGDMEIVLDTRMDEWIRPWLSPWRFNITWSFLLCILC